MKYTILHRKISGREKSMKTKNDQFCFFFLHKRWPHNTLKKIIQEDNIPSNWSSSSTNNTSILQSL